MLWLVEGSGYPLPLFTFTAEELIMTRTGPRPQDIIFDGGANPVFGVDHMPFSPKVGVRFNLILHNYGHSPFDQELNHMQLDQFEEIRTPSAPGAFFLFFGGVPVNPQNYYNVRYSSEFTSSELNFRHQSSPQCTWSLGIRHIELWESYDIVTSFAGGVESGFFSGGTNKLYGGQVGHEFIWWEECGHRLETTLKAGAFYNDIYIEAEASDTGGAPLRREWNTSRLSVVGGSEDRTGDPCLAMRREDRLSSPLADGRCTHARPKRQPQPVWFRTE